MGDCKMSTAIRTPYGYYLQGAWMEEGGIIALSYQHLATGTMRSRKVKPNEETYQVAQALLRKVEQRYADKEAVR